MLIECGRGLLYGLVIAIPVRNSQWVMKKLCNVHFCPIKVETIDAKLNSVASEMQVLLCIAIY